MQSFSASPPTSNESPLHEAVDSAHTRVGRARHLAASILDTTVRLYSQTQEGSGRGWLWRYAR